MIPYALSAIWILNESEIWLNILMDSQMEILRRWDARYATICLIGLISWQDFI